MNSLLPPETPSSDWTHVIAIYSIVNICELNCRSLNSFFHVVSLCVLNSMFSWPPYSLAREVQVGNISFEQTFTDLAARTVLQNHLASARDVAGSKLKATVAISLRPAHPMLSLPRCSAILG